MPQRSRSRSRSPGYAVGFPMSAAGILASLDYDFQNGRYYQSGQGVDPLVLTTTSRASTGYADNLAGEWSSFLSNVPRITNKGFLVEEARTNVVLWDRDLTNVAWTKSNVTAALNQTGIDGAANSATSLTATAGNGTALQAITLASSARFQSAFVKRITGTGIVNMTMDNGSTWTAVTVTAAWTRVTIPTQTLANPTVGFRIVTSGDAIAVDFVQNENGIFATSPIRTTSAAATRAADVVTATTVPTIGSTFSFFGKGTPLAPKAYTTAQMTGAVSDGTAANRAQLYRNPVDGFATTATIGSTILVGAKVSSFPWETGTSGKIAGAFATGDYPLAFNGLDAGPPTTASTIPSGLTVFNIGNRPGAQWFNGYIERIALWPTTRLSNANLQRITV